MWKSLTPEGKSGKWVVERFTVNGMQSFFSGFDPNTGGSNRAVLPGEYTRLVRYGGYFPETVMSDTSAEHKDHAPFIRVAKGNVLIAGLGLGLVLSEVAAKEEVTSITVVENSTDVINLVWPHLPCTVKGKTTLIVGDVYDSSTIKKGSGYDYAWFDIWPSICGDNVKEMGLLKTKYRCKVKTMMFWAERLCKLENAKLRTRQKTRRFYTGRKTA